MTGQCVGKDVRELTRDNDQQVGTSCWFFATSHDAQRRCEDLWGSWKWMPTDFRGGDPVSGLCDPHRFLLRRDSFLVLPSSL